MAYNNGFPVNYQYYQQPMQPVQMMPQMQQQQQYQVNNGFVRVRNENEARTYFVAPGNSVTFIDDDSRYIFTKTVNMGQLDRPIFEKYRLVKEEDTPSEQPEKQPVPRETDLSKYALKDDVEGLRSGLEAAVADIETMRHAISDLNRKRLARREEPADE